MYVFSLHVNAHGRLQHFIIVIVSFEGGCFGGIFGTVRL